MKKQLFVEQVNIEVKEGIKVDKEMTLIYKAEGVEQTLNNLVLETMVEKQGSNGINSYENKSYIKLQLNEGDILLFDESRGYYMPTFPVTSINDAIDDINSLKDVQEMYERMSEDDTEGTETENTEPDRGTKSE